MFKARQRRVLTRLLPSAVRERIVLKQRAMVSLLDDLLEKVGELASNVPLALDQTRVLGARIHHDLLGDLALEARILVPALRVSDAWGETRAEQLMARHRVRRSELKALLVMLRQVDPSALIGDLRDFVALRKADMKHVERNDLGAGVLRDDVMGLDVNGG